MAFSTVEQQLIELSGPEKRLQLIVTCTLSGGDTTGTIIPGNNTSSIDGSSYLRNIEFVSYYSTTASPAEVRFVKSYNTTTDSDQLAITAAANQAFVVKIEGPSSGG